METLVLAPTSLRDTGRRSDLMDRMELLARWRSGSCPMRGRHDRVRPGGAWVAGRCSALPRFAHRPVKMLRQSGYFVRLMGLLICGL